MKVRCNIGCGCNKNKNKQSRSKRISSQRVKQLKTRNKQTPKAKRKVNILSKITEPNKKNLICMACPQSAQTSKEKKRGLKICHKTNRLVTNLIKDGRFTCPIGNWDKIK